MSELVIGPGDFQFVLCHIYHLKFLLVCQEVHESLKASIVGQPGIGVHSVQPPHPPGEIHQSNNDKTSFFNAFSFQSFFFGSLGDSGRGQCVWGEHAYITEYHQ